MDGDAHLLAFGGHEDPQEEWEPPGARAKDAPEGSHWPDASRDPAWRLHSPQHP